MKLRKGNDLTESMVHGLQDLNIQIINEKVKRRDCVKCKNETQKKIEGQGQ